MYDLGIIHKQKYKYEVQRMQERWISQFFIEERKWKMKLQKLHYR
jgi:hypothetical protein